jgi:pSer/pThr/pTyr-binding forkhead associated (FHA) protein
MAGFLHVAKRQARSLSNLASQGTRGAAENVSPGAGPRSRLTLVVIRSPGAGQRESHLVAGSRYSVGRDSDNDLVLREAGTKISRRHFAVGYWDEHWQLSDYSTNGTYLNRETKPIGSGARRTLNNGDRIRLGPYEIEVKITEEAVVETPDPWVESVRPRDDYQELYSASTGYVAVLEAYVERLLKLIPTEVVSIYPVGRALLGNGQDGIWAVICLIICVVFRCRLTRGSDGDPQWDAVGISAVSFIIWVYVLGSHLPGFPLPSEYHVWPALAMIAWTTITPTIFMARSA